jgi:hypothetical protein
MKITIKNIFAGLLIVPLLALGSISITTPVSAYVCSDGTTAESGAKCAKPENVPDCLFGEDCAFTRITNAALFIIGAVSVLMLIYGGIRYTISGGDTAAVTAAKNTILYAIVGIVVALLAFAIVNFVLEKLVAA